MKQTFTTKLIVIAIGCITVIQGWSFIPINQQLYINHILTDFPGAVTLITIGMLLIGIAAGSEEKGE